MNAFIFFHFFFDQLLLKSLAYSVCFLCIRHESHNDDNRKQPRARESAEKTQKIPEKRKSFPYRIYHNIIKLFRHRRLFSYIFLFYTLVILFRVLCLFSVANTNKKQMKIASVFVDGKPTITHQTNREKNEEKKKSRKKWWYEKA